MHQNSLVVVQALVDRGALSQAPTSVHAPFNAGKHVFDFDKVAEAWAKDRTFTNSSGIPMSRSSFASMWPDCKSVHVLWNDGPKVGGPIRSEMVLHVEAPFARRHVASDLHFKTFDEAYPAIRKAWQGNARFRPLGAHDYLTARELEVLNGEDSVSVFFYCEENARYGAGFSSSTWTVINLRKSK